MYFAGPDLRSVFAFDFDLEEGAISGRRVFAHYEAPALPDGATVDAEGFLWCAAYEGWRITRYAPDGRIDRIVEMPVQKPTSCMFGGPDLSILYVTSAIWDLTPDKLRDQPAAGGLFALDLGIRGVPEPRFAG
jgi:sugar lactone lactonase YvrE